MLPDSSRRPIVSSAGGRPIKTAMACSYCGALHADVDVLRLDGQNLRLGGATSALVVPVAGLGP